jgi:predicted ester cyclase
MSAETNHNLALVRRFYEEVINQQNVAAIDAILAPAFARNGHGHGPRGEAALARACFAAFPDVRATIEELVVDGDRIAARTSWRATHRGTWHGIPATGRVVAWEVMAFLRVGDGRLQSAWVVEDDLALARQLRPTESSADRRAPDQVSPAALSLTA